MSAPQRKDLSKRATQRSRIRSVAVILPVLGIFLFASPLIKLTTIAPDVLGIPPIMLYVFGCWLFLILLTNRAARRISADGNE